jgi:hypothetical protein
MYTIKRCKEISQLKCRRLLYNGYWYAVFWRQPTYLRKVKTVTCPSCCLRRKIDRKMNISAYCRPSHCTNIVTWADITQSVCSLSYGLEDWGIVFDSLQGLKILDRLRKPPSLLFSGYQGLFSESKAVGSWSWLTEICRETPKLFKNLIKIWALYMIDLSTFMLYCWQQ